MSCKQISDRNRFRMAIRMAANMAKMIDWPYEEKMERACGDVQCAKCGLPYFDHPRENGLVLDCNGRLWKL